MGSFKYAGNLTEWRIVNWNASFMPVVRICSSCLVLSVEWSINTPAPTQLRIGREQRNPRCPISQIAKPIDQHEWLRNRAVRIYVASLNWPDIVMQDETDAAHSFDSNCDQASCCQALSFIVQIKSTMNTNTWDLSENIGQTGPYEPSALKVTNQQVTSSAKDMNLSFSALQCAVRTAHRHVFIETPFIPSIRALIEPSASVHSYLRSTCIFDLAFAYCPLDTIDSSFTMRLSMRYERISFSWRDSTSIHHSCSNSNNRWGSYHASLLQMHSHFEGCRQPVNMDRTPRPHSTRSHQPWSICLVEIYEWRTCDRDVQKRDGNSYNIKNEVP
jgi:hypothetical protein